ncbi:dynein axonemal heavy chain 7 [Neodiprion pinetum]|uniref:dynein axonemal heavy chain 7 n=1 Tax=Neodiprion pinetum TaxID=441929 RepID=UPI003724759E
MLGDGSENANSQSCTAPNTHLRECGTGLPPSAKSIHGVKKRRRRVIITRDDLSAAKQRVSREEFRRYFVGTVVKPDLPRIDVDLKGDREVNRYYYYIRNGVDAIHVAPLESKILDNISLLVPKTLWGYEVRDKLVKEIKDDFLLAVKRSIVEFVLKDFHDREGSQDEKEQIEMPENYIEQYHKHQLVIERDLYLIHTCVRQMLEVWIHCYVDFHLIDISVIEGQQKSWDLIAFQTLLTQQIERSRDYLKYSWFSDIQNIFLMNDRKHIVPSPLQRKKFKRFYDCVYKFMESQLLAICRQTMSQYMNYIFGIGYRNPGFVLRVTIKNRECVFDPPCKYFVEVLSSLLDAMLQAVSGFPRLETQLYLDWSGPPAFLKPKVSPVQVAVYKKQISALIEEQRVEPQTRLADFEKYEHLFNDKESEQVNAFLNDETKTFTDYAELIAKYHKLAFNITAANEPTIFMGLFEVSRKECLNVINGNVNAFKNALINRMVRDYQAICTS